jgi:hypothetical protein
MSGEQGKEYENLKDFHREQSREEDSNRDEKRIKRIKLKRRAITQNANLKKSIIDMALKKEKEINIDDMSINPSVQEET